MARRLFFHPSFSCRNSGAGAAPLLSSSLSPSLSPLLHHRVPPALPLFPSHYAAAPSAHTVEQEHRTESHRGGSDARTHARTPPPVFFFPAVSRYGAAAFPAAYQVRPRRGMGGHRSRVSQPCVESCQSRGCWRKSAAIFSHFSTSAQESSSRARL